MNLLAIDTSTHRASIALKVDQNIYTAEETELRRHAEWVLPSIQQLLKEAQVSLSELDGLVFGQGPGSFTGLRVSCSVAKGLALGGNLFLYPVSSLASIAAQVQGENILAMIDARMQAWYWAGFHNGHAVTSEQVTHPAEVVWNAKGSLVLAGVNFSELYGQLPRDLLAQVVSQQEVYPSALSMIQLVEQGEIQHVSVQDARPKYIRQQVT
jgi:tRNA threonylcarbamoyladenosine biosynthesis protein TsaB